MFLISDRKIYYLVSTLDARHYTIVETDDECGDFLLKIGSGKYWDLIRLLEEVGLEDRCGLGIYSVPRNGLRTNKYFNSILSALYDDYEESRFIEFEMYGKNVVDNIDWDSSYPDINVVLDIFK